jgi:hypothetical protein
VQLWAKNAGAKNIAAKPCAVTHGSFIEAVAEHQRNGISPAEFC